MKIESVDFPDSDSIPALYTCDGKDVNPELILSGVPGEAKTLALIMDDPDAPMGTWVHWLLWNVPVETFRILVNTVPTGAVQGRNSWGKSKYGGPCPPSGTHRYFFKLYALDTRLQLDEQAGVKELEKSIANHILEKAELMGTYSRTH